MSQPPYDRPPSGHTGQGRPAGARGSTVVALVIAGIVVLVAVAVGLALVVGHRQGAVPIAVGASAPSSGSASTAGASPATDIPPPTVPPQGLGDDPGFDALAQECYDGDMAACDALYAATEDDDSLATYSEYADTCAGRQEGGTSQYCTDAFPGD